MIFSEKKRGSCAGCRVLLTGFFFGLIAAGGACAQDATQKTAQPGETAARRPDTNAAYEQTLLDAEALIKDGNPAEAYVLLEPLEFEHSGEERFDYLIGIAALDSGKPDKATFAFERVLAINPNSAAARLDMARAYYMLGDMPRAKTEFLAVREQDISGPARANVEKYLGEIEVRESGSKTRLGGYIEGTVGRDSNVNASTNQTQILVNAIPIGPITLAPVNIETPDSYRGLAAGAEIRHSLDSGWELYAGGDWRKRNYSAQNPFDAESLGARAGLAYATKAERFRMTILNGWNDLGGLRNYDTTGWNGEWRHMFSPANQANIFVQQANYRYADLIMKPNDFDQQTAGVGWLHVSVDGRSTLSGSLYRGTEKDTSTLITAATPVGGRADGGKRFNGLRIDGQTALGEETILFADAGVQVGNYDKINALFMRQRNDRFTDATAGVSWNFAKRWTLRPQMSYSKNSSNIVIYGYTRRDVSLTIRRDFR